MSQLAIDFGTSNSAVAVRDGGHSQILALEPARSTMPSALFFDSENKKALFGSPANNAVVERMPGRYMRSMKSVLGTSLMHEPFRALGKRTTFVEIIALYLSELKSRAEDLTGKRFTAALSGRPVFFHSDDESRNAKALEDLQLCYRQAGFDHCAFLPEPEAAAIAVGGNVAQGDVGLVVDIGGGTSDFSIFKKDAHNELSILCSHGERVGGTDFDRLLSYYEFMPLLGRGTALGKTSTGQQTLMPNGMYADLSTWEKINTCYDPQRMRLIANWRKTASQPEHLDRLSKVLDEQLGHVLISDVEAAKIALSTDVDQVHQVQLSHIDENLSHSLIITALDASIKQAIDKIIKGVVTSIEKSDLKPNDITDVIFVGGSSTLPVLVVEVMKKLPHAQRHNGAVFTAIIDGLAQKLEP